MIGVCLRVTAAFLCAAPRLAAQNAAPEADRILAELSARKGELVGYKLSAVSTDVVFFSNHPAIEALQAKPEIRDALKGMVNRNGEGRTNTVSHTYSFQENALWLESLTRDSSGKPVHKQNQAATKTERLNAEAFLDAAVSVLKHTNNLTGEIKKAESGRASGVPLFLGRGTLWEWLSAASVTGRSQSTAPNGEDCFDLKFTGAPSGVDGSDLAGRLVLRASDLTPAQLEFHGPEGAVQYSAEIQFGDAGYGLSLCKSATLRYYHGKSLFRLSMWHLVAVEAERPRETPTIMSFFPARTYLRDERFARPLSYRLGSRPPTEAEIRRMLTDTNGVAVALYEAATDPAGRPDSFRGRRVILLVGALVILTGGPAFAVWLNRSGRASRETRSA